MPRSTTDNGGLENGPVTTSGAPAPIETTQGSAKSPPVEETPWLDPAARPFIEIQGVSKTFGDFCAVDHVDLAIYRGELFSILGGSGSGKTTLLRMLAGFETPSSGRLIIDGVDITALPPYERPVNMMFQSYALFPHMTVAQNIAYGLKRENMAKSAIAKRVEEMLALVQLQDFAKRKPAQLSGGQRQRVALARALAKRPKVLLLDEPLAALDKKLREQTQFELVNIQDELGVTFVVVTHDQEEAMTLSTRIAIMNQGRFMQVGTPHEIYENPQNRFVADFVGSINFFEGRVEGREGDKVRIHLPEIGHDVVMASGDDAVSPGQSVTVALRPEKIFVSKEAPAASAGRIIVKGTIHDQGYFGKLSVFHVRTGGGKIIQVSAQNRVRFAKRAWDWDEDVCLSWDPDSLLLMADEGGRGES